MHTVKVDEYVFVKNELSNTDVVKARICVKDSYGERCEVFAAVVKDFPWLRETSITLIKLKIYASALELASKGIFEILPEKGEWAIEIVVRDEGNDSCTIYFPYVSSVEGYACFDVTAVAVEVFSRVAEIMKHVEI